MNDTPRQRRRAGQPALDLIEEAARLLRRAPAWAVLSYYIGSVPFWLGVLYFIADMGRDAYAAARLGEASLVLALLYIWRKSWQTIFASQLRATLLGTPDAAWTARRIGDLLLVQAAVQPWSLILRPLAFAITVPYVWVSSFFQNVTVLGDGTPSRDSVVKRAIDQAKLWPVQAHVALSILAVFVFFIWLNVCVALVLGPQLLKTFFNVETVFSKSVDAYLNTTFFVTTFALTSLCFDPLWKAVYVLRCFHGAAVSTGEDLVLELKRLRTPARRAATVAAAFFVLIAALPADAAMPQPARPTVQPSELNERIERVLERREYAWRAPRQKVEEQRGWIGGWMEEAAKTVMRWCREGVSSIKRFFKWLFERWFPKPSSHGSSGAIDWAAAAHWLLWVSIGVLAGMLAWSALRALRKRRSETVATALPAVPDLRAEDVAPDALPEARWLELAREYADRGDLQLALRAAWLACLAHLGHREFLRIARYKSNSDYHRELRRRARADADLLMAFGENLTAFERAWYGRHTVTPKSFADFTGNLERIRAC